MDEKIVLEEEIRIIDYFMTQSNNSVYEHKQSREIITSALKGIVRKRENRDEQQRRKKWRKKPS